MRLNLLIFMCISTNSFENFKELKTYFGKVSKISKITEQLSENKEKVIEKKTVEDILNIVVDKLNKTLSPFVTVVEKVAEAVELSLKESLGRLIKKIVLVII